MNLLKIARKPPIVASPEDTVGSAVESMTGANVGAIVIVENNKPVGIFTERDLMTRVVHKNLSVPGTLLKTVMTAHPHTAPAHMEAGEAFEFMTDKRFRHLPLVDGEGRVIAMLSVRHLMETISEHLSHELENLSAYLTADGIGG